MTYTVSSGTLNSSIPYHTIPRFIPCWYQYESLVATGSASSQNCSRLPRKVLSWQARPSRRTREWKTLNSAVKLCSLLCICCFRSNASVHRDGNGRIYWQPSHDSMHCACTNKACSRLPRYCCTCPTVCFGISVITVLSDLSCKVILLS